MYDMSCMYEIYITVIESNIQQRHNTIIYISAQKRDTCYKGKINFCIPVTPVIHV